MFEVHGGRILLTRGDTGVLTVQAEAGGYAFTQRDRMVFTIRGANGRLLKEEAACIEPDGRAKVGFANEETQAWREGSYRWDVRYVLEAQTDENGRVQDGRAVITPMPPGEFRVMPAVGRV